MKILIITHSNDEEGIDNVIATLQYHNATVCRLNTNHYPSQIQLSSYYIDSVEQIILTNQNFTYNLREFDAVWYRRMRVEEGFPNDVADEHKEPAIEESKITLWGMLASLDTDKFVLDSIVNIRRADSKQLQLKIASQLDLHIPATLISNSANAVRSFGENFPMVISKMQYEFKIHYEGSDVYRVYSYKWQAEELAELEDLDLSPMVFQEYVAKAYELRVTIVGNQFFCGKIPSQTSDKGKEDWRKDKGLVKQIKPYELPEDIKSKLLRLMDYFQLNYGAIDLIKTPEGKYVFLEINPVGEFSWLDEVLDKKISEAIANVLLNCAYRR